MVIYRLLYIVVIHVAACQSQMSFYFHFTIPELWDL